MDLYSQWMTESTEYSIAARFDFHAHRGCIKVFNTRGSNDSMEFMNQIGSMLVKQTQWISTQPKHPMTRK
jgi:hypothetical protein